MKQLIAALCIIAAFHANAQTVYLADTAFVTDVGIGGAPTSCKTNGMMYNGLSMERTEFIWLADAFTVPSGETWVFDTVIVYGYQFGSTTTSPFMSCNLQIYNGAPGLGGSVIWGDTITNVLKGAAFTGIYKVDTIAANGGLMSDKRPIMALKLHLSPAPSLTAGTYWLSWSATCASTFNPAVCPYKVLPGRLNPPGQVSRILYPGSSWQYATDNGLNIGLNKIIKAKAGLAALPAIAGNARNTLSQNIPNPFSNTTEITYNLAVAGDVTLAVYNILGQVVATLANGHMSAGTHSITFNANNLPPGSYYYKLSAPAGAESKQMVVMK
ncbi:MAG: hypothetical protein K0Q79_2733 [Flavipsychrobacter sp.]|nr:hypothetical protein [Flavipsychrobacter sp.]